MTDVTNAPGCFGAASVYDAGSEVCGRCSFNAACAEQARATLERIRGRLNVTDLLRKHDRAKPPAPVAPVAAPVQAAAPAPVAQAPVVPVRVTPLERVELTPDAAQALLLAKLPVKPREIAERLLRTGRVCEIQRDVQAGVNPFATAKPEFLRVAFDALLSGGCDRSALKQRFQDQLGWGDGTASSHVGIVSALLQWLGVATINEGRMEVKK